ncbi:putative bifunctional diguanylate cyclase/phosphodiesterase [Mesorhizobium sp. ES1-4]|uniref:putative bifunctional diguanylate cyclase/phosphodiesterase n=1 Tax=Mesorhizobium sp. ES1-4 TaxID=2876627 RepID=UPI001CCD7434|nr:EAL domain-containing protein [Mesorhizobium sp. ES1-4]MBZ9797621.1 EAL domain-containing protein [Mesorhizobium sp. ES1-4]
MNEITETNLNGSNVTPFRFGRGEAVLRNFVENATIPTFLFNTDGVIVYANRAGSHVLGYAAGECVGIHFTAIVHPDNLATARTQTEDLITGKIQGYQAERRYIRKDGETIWALTSVSLMPGDENQVRYLSVQAVDIDRRKRAEAALTKSERRLQVALDTSQIGVFEGDLETGELFWDDRAHDIFGIPRGRKSLHAADWENALHPEDAAKTLEAMSRAIEEKGTFNAKFRIIRADGEIRTLRSRATYFQDDGATPKFIGANWDITDEVALEERLTTAKALAEARNVELEAAKARIETQALHDALTGLPNRRYLDQILNQYRNRSRLPGDSLALLHIDLDRFKQINDTLGHAAGDAMLVHVARLLNAKVAGQHFVARVGGDEFVIACFNDADVQGLAGLADQIIAEIGQPVPYEGHFCRLGASIGIALETGADIDTPRELINADIALYRAKGRGRNRHEFFSKALQSEIETTKHMADEILSGIEQGEFHPYYQPLLNATSLDIIGVEALVRWHHPTEGILSPIRFLRIAEDLNVLAAIDRSILQQAMVDLDQWQSQGIAVPSVSVNVSFRRLSDDRLIPGLRELNIRPGAISFEFLESIFLDELDDGVAWNIDALRDMGIGIDIDDFGTGHTSIVSLLKLRPRHFKIDRQLINPIAHMPEQRRLVASIIDIGRSLGIKVVAEGVETIEQARILQELGCDILQGFAFARPMPADQLVGWIAGEKWRKAS